MRGGFQLLGLVVLYTWRSTTWRGRITEHVIFMTLIGLTLFCYVIGLCQLSSWRWQNDCIWERFVVVGVQLPLNQEFCWLQSRCQHRWKVSFIATSEVWIYCFHLFVYVKYCLVFSVVCSERWAQNHSLTVILKFEEITNSWYWLFFSCTQARDYPVTTALISWYFCDIKSLIRLTH